MNLSSGGVTHNLGLWRFNPAIRRASSDQVFEKLLNTH
jgi:hypothetical protein